MPLAPEPKVTCGAVLVKKLAETGTGASKLAPCRKLLADVHRSEQGRIASAKEVFDVLYANDAPEGTLLKARTIIETGEWHGPPSEIEVPIEVQLLGDGAVVEYKAAEEAKQAEALKKFKDAEKPKPDQPGIHASPDFGDKGVVGPQPVSKGRGKS